jgi:hypothetical protein
MWMGLIQSIEDLKMNNEAFQRKYSLSNSNIKFPVSYMFQTFEPTITEPTP